MAVTVAELTGEQIEIVTDVMRDTFADFEDLGRFMRMKLDIKLTDIVEPSGLRKAAPDVVEDAEQTGYVPKLLAMLRRESDSAALKGVIDALGIRIDDYPAAAARELSGMEAVAANLVTRDVIVGFGPDIIKLCILATRLGGLKFLHDKVELVRNRVYVPLEAIRARMPAIDADQIAVLHWELLRYQTDIRTKVAEVKIPDGDIPWIENQLEPAQQKLLFASRNWPAEPEINDVVRLLSRVTSAELNAMIKPTAISIGELDFHGKLAQLKTGTVAIADAKLVSDFVDDIERIDAGIVIMLDHLAADSRWQSVKGRLDELINLLGRPIDEARWFWEILERRLGKVDKPPEGLAAAREAVEAAFAAQDPRALRWAVNDLRTTICVRLYTIDNELLADATYVSQLGDGLQKVLEKLDG